MAETVKFLLKISDNGTFKQVEVDVDSLREAMKKVKQEAQSLNSGIINWSQTMQAISQVRDSVNQLSQTMMAGVEAYSRHEVANQKLVNNMRNTMDATDDEVQSILALAEAQKQLGIISDDVQIAGAQELATYLEQKSSLEQLIPVMNDMLAQQYGLEASQESAAQIASMLGKVMSGQVEALSRYGYKFDEAQKQVLQFGTEEERAAVLAEVVESSVGGMNESLAQTDAGKAKKMADFFEDVEEELGQVLVRISPVVGLFNKVVDTGSGITKMVLTFKQLSESISLASAKTLLLTVHTKAQAAAQRLLTVATGSTTVSTWALNAAVTALYATLTMGISVAIVALVSLFSDSGDAAEDAAAKTDLLKEATDAYADSVKQAQSSIQLDISNLKHLIETNGNAVKTVAELNRKYGESMGYHRTAAEWYDTLVTKSKAYCAQLGYEAQAKAIASKMAEKSLRIDELEELTQPTAAIGSPEERKQLIAYQNELKRLKAEMPKLTANYDRAVKKMQEARQEVENQTKTADVAGKALSIETMSLEELGLAIQNTTEQLKSLSPQETAEIGRLSKLLDLLQKRKKYMDNLTGINKDTPKKEKKEKEETPVNTTNPETIDELSAAITEYEKRLKKTNPAEQETITLLTKQINLWKQKKESVEDQIDAATRPTELNTLAAIDEALARQQKLRKTANKEQLAEIDKEIERLNALRTAFESVPKTLKVDASTLKDIESNISILEEQLQNATQAEAAAINKSIQAWKKKADAIRKEGVEEKKAVKTGDKVNQGLQDMSSLMQNLSGLTSEGASNWLMYGANVLQAVAAMMPALASVIGGNIAQAYSGAAAQSQTVQFPFNLIALAASMAAVTAAVASIPKYADGGLAYGPTLGIFGEYAGASSNPEVVAPLNKLKALIAEDNGNNINGQVVFKIKGRYLEGILEREHHIHERS